MGCICLVINQCHHFSAFWLRSSVVINQSLLVFLLRCGQWCPIITIIPSLGASTSHLALQCLSATDLYQSSGRNGQTHYTILICKPYIESWFSVRVQNHQHTMETKNKGFALALENLSIQIPIPPHRMHRILINIFYFLISYTD